MRGGPDFFYLRFSLSALHDDRHDRSHSFWSAIDPTASPAGGVELCRFCLFERCRRGTFGRPAGIDAAWFWSMSWCWRAWRAFGATFRRAWQDWPYDPYRPSRNIRHCPKTAWTECGACTWRAALQTRELWCDIFLFVIYFWETKGQEDMRPSDLHCMIHFFITFFEDCLKETLSKAAAFI